MVRLSQAALTAALTCSFAFNALSAPADAALKHRASAVHAAAALPAVPELHTYVFARGSAKLFKPDGIVVTKHYVFVVYQNDSDANPVPSTIVKYDHEGKVLGSVDLLGRCDGMRYNPVTHKLWALLNNDGANSSPTPRPALLYTVDPKTLAATKYTFATAPAHGGGYDDIAFINGQAYFSASSPTLNPVTNVDDKPAVVKATLTTSGTVAATPILNGTTFGYDVTNKKTGPLQFNDPDSLAVDTANDLVLVSEGDQQVAIVKNPGTGKQSVTRYGLGTGIDDVAWTRGTHGTLFVADETVNVIYAVTAKFPQGTVFVEATSGTPVPSFIGTADSGGNLTPLLTERDGIFNPTSLIFTQAEIEPEDQ